MLVLDVPPLVGHIIAAHTAHLRPTLINKHEVYPVAGVSLISTYSPFVESHLRRLMAAAPSTIRLSSARMDVVLNVTTTQGEPVAVVYDPNAMVHHLASMYRQQVPPQSSRSPRQITVKIIPSQISSIPFTTTIFNASSSASSGTSSGLNIGPRTSHHSIVAWLPLAPPLSYSITTSATSIIITTNLFNFDIISCLRLAEIVLQHLRMYKL